MRYRVDRAEPIFRDYHVRYSYWVDVEMDQRTNGTWVLYNGSEKVAEGDGSATLLRAMVEATQAAIAHDISHMAKGKEGNAEIDPASK